MKYIKTYEQNNNEPQIGDYVICTDQNPEVSEFTLNNVGKIVKYILMNNDRFPYKVKYKNVPVKLIDKGYIFDNNDIRKTSRDEIIHWSKNKKDLELILYTKKYNL